MSQCLYQGLTQDQDGEGIAFSNMTKETGADGTGEQKWGSIQNCTLELRLESSSGLRSVKR